MDHQLAVRLEDRSYGRHVDVRRREYDLPLIMRCRSARDAAKRVSRDGRQYERRPKITQVSSLLLHHPDLDAQKRTGRHRGHMDVDDVLDPEKGRTWRSYSQSFSRCHRSATMASRALFLTEIVTISGARPTGKRTSKVCCEAVERRSIGGVRAGDGARLAWAIGDSGMNGEGCSGDGVSPGECRDD